MKTRTYKHYEVRTSELNGGSYSPSGYSKYNERFDAKYKGRLNGEVYGVEQAREHIAELRESVYDGKKHLAEKTFFIMEVVTTVKCVAKVLPVP